MTCQMGSRGEALGRPNSEPAHTWDHVLNQTTEKGNFLFLQVLLLLGFEGTK